MTKLRTLLLAGVLGALAACTAGAQSAPSGFVPLSTLVKSANSAVLPIQAGSTDPLHMVSIRGGAMVSPRGAGLIGADFELPTLSLGNDWHGRVDGDVIFKANFGGIDTIVPVTVDQLYYSPNAVSGHNVYWGAGLGAVISGPVKFDGKLILGTEVTTRIGAELNVHFTETDTLLTLMVRIHL